MQKKWTGYFVGSATLIVVVLILFPFRDRMNSTPVALSFLLVVLYIAAAYGKIPAIAMSIASMLCFNYFFLPPYHTFTIADPQNWIALLVFLITSLIAGNLSASVKRRADESERKQKHIEQLYLELQTMFKKVSQTDAIKQSEQLKSALLDAVTHDLRTPLTSMKAAVTTLLSPIDSQLTLDEEGRREMLEVINTEIDRLNHHLEGLIEIAKIEAGAMQPRMSWTNLDEIVSISTTRAAGLLTKNRTRIEYEENLPLVRVDEKGISEVLYLLLENAVKYSPSGSEISIDVRKTDDGFIRLSVEDQGAGIPPGLRDKVFDKFFRFPSESGDRLRPSGLGMGLAIARAIVEAHKGRIWIENPLRGKGTRVSFTIPLAAAEAKMD